MWKLKQFMPKETNSLEGRMIDVGNIKLQVRNVIAEGGFSCVYLARDAVNSSKQYALKHIICQDGESLQLAMKEISVMKMLKGHPNVVALIAHATLDMGRVKEVMLVMEFCEKSLVAVLENRGAGYYEEKQILLIFRDICNAVFALHCQSPPIAHRDLKAENVLLGADGAWKLCDFGSTSTNHKCFDRPEEMGIEEDNIRKHTTPAYRAPEMWDLYRREVISEKVDIWALGCLLYRICYFKSAFDGESKLQILNGNYRIPEVPKYGNSITKLIKDMLQASPDSRPDITQLWFRVNELLPVELQKELPDNSMCASAVEMRSSPSGLQDNVVQKRTPMMPRRSPPPPPSHNSSAETQQSRSSQIASASNRSGSPLGTFWSTQHVQGSPTVEEKGPVFDEEPSDQSKSKHNPRDSAREHRVKSPPRHSRKSPEVGSSEDYEIRFSPNGSEYGPEKTKAFSQTVSQNQAFNMFVAEFDTSKLNSGNVVSGVSDKHRSTEEDLKAELNRLKQELKQVNLEKEEITSKYEKLSAICRSQRQEIQELKRAVAAATSPASKDSNSQISPGTSHSDTPVLFLIALLKQYSLLIEFMSE
ncbi:AP2-associated protein kinase 1-like [Canna indica]|uniref:non-specific serine/threonine protein kinase n=1 Tax=Canna indica TaxID=4628 RepID=A0AAQ3JMV3_9LILI|nr:AP2-associated protein kinase 1-like [Canna indica]